MTQINRHPLLNQAYCVCLAIEKCGASPELTEAVTQASALLRDLDQYIPEADAVSGLDFGQAVYALKQGHKVARAGWNGTGMWLVLDPGSVVSEARPGSVYDKAGITGTFTINGHIDMRTATGEMQPGWLASQTDMLATDWAIVDGGAA
ncbi:DUF2829 domain-containing protein [Pseudomonas sp. F(2018)]|uniref:DUF2829 domain-containing protein n=1 Tax=Pseudomonas sp. F(2018) TaxID=2502240 RepID=UPI001C49AC92|nr:DUF2829 domain-containing protein [Pseudomonas sp. F(2018)]